MRWRNLSLLTAGSLWQVWPPATHSLQGRNASLGYHCFGKDIVQGRGVYCLNVGGVQVDQAVVDAFLQALTPAAVEARNSPSSNWPQTKMRPESVASAGGTGTLRSRTC